MESGVYRQVYLHDMGYVVYRFSFNLAKCTLRDGALSHKTAVFVTESEALDYCRYRNRLIDERGSDRLDHGDDLRKSQTKT